MLYVLARDYLQNDFPNEMNIFPEICLLTIKNDCKRDHWQSVPGIQMINDANAQLREKKAEISPSEAIEFHVWFISTSLLTILVCFRFLSIVFTSSLNNESGLCLVNTARDSYQSSASDSSTFDSFTISIFIYLVIF
jgi:hypothetical protein